jgi:hypothetical protein
LNTLWEDCMQLNMINTVLQGCSVSVFQWDLGELDQPSCPYKHKVVFTIEITTQQDLTCPLTGPAQLTCNSHKQL